MLKVWENVYTVTIPANVKALGFALQAPQYGYIKRFSIKQIGGSSVGATVDVYSLPVVATEVGGSAKSSIDSDLAKIIDQLTVTSGAVTTKLSEYLGWAYYNNFSGIAVPDRHIYVHIDQASTPAAQTTWGISLVIAEPT